MNSNNIDLVIFDMDGTMFDTERLGVEKWVEAFKQLGLPVPEKTLYDKIGLSGKDAKEKMKRESGFDFDYDTVKSLKKKLTLESISKNGTPVKNGLFEVLNFLDKSSIKKAVATSRSKDNALFYMQHVNENFSKKFDFILTGDVVKKGKPDPEIFLTTAKNMQTLPAKTLVLEDSLNGIRASYSAGMKSIMIPDLVAPDAEAKQKATFICNSLLDVPHIIQQINCEKKTKFRNFNNLFSNKNLTNIKGLE